MFCKCKGFVGISIHKTVLNVVKNRSWVSSAQFMIFYDEKEEPNQKVCSNFMLAGVVGFEPTVHATKKRCLTTWLHPNSVNVLLIIFPRCKRAFKLMGELFSDLILFLLLFFIN